VIVRNCNNSSEVNAPFTIGSYAMPMVRAAHNLVLFAAITLLASLALPSSAFAQSAEVEWEDAGIASQGSLPSGTTATGSDGTVATVTYNVQTQGGGSFTSPFAPTHVSTLHRTNAVVLQLQ